MMKSRIICILLLLVGASGIYAQSLTVTGKVVDNEGLEVIGGNVTVKGKQNTGTITDINGKYTITVSDPQKDVLVFSFIGLENMEVAVKGRKQIDVTMKAASVLLDEVVAIGYATVKRKDLTGSVASVRSDDLLKVPSSDVTQALAGRMAGVQIIQTDGQPGATMSVRVRGGISITQSNEPLYIIDGFPTEDGMSSLDPADIESIDVLKDASATAIYGARGANGVVVITTKSGAKSEGKATLTFDSYVGVRTLAKRLDVLSVEEFVLADYERTLGDATDPEESMRSWQNRYGGFVDLHENYGNRKGIDWLDRTMGRTTVTQNYRVGINGGNDKLNYNMSYGYFKDEGAMVYSGSDKHNIALSVKSEVNKRLSVTGRINFDYLKVYGAGVAGNGTNEGGSNVDAKFNKMVQILQYRPTIGIRGSDSDLLAGEDPVLSDADGNVMQNPLIAAAEEKDNKETRTLQANGGLTFKIMKGLTLSVQGAANYSHVPSYSFTSSLAKPGQISGMENASRMNLFWQNTNNVTYNTSFGDHHLTATAVFEASGAEGRNLKLTGSDLANEFVGYWNAKNAKTRDGENGYSAEAIVSGLGRIMYNYKGKYMLTGTFRADGSSKFQKKNKWGYFPSAAVAWDVAKENFMSKQNIVQQLKLRASFGVVGNQSIGAYTTLGMLAPTNYDGYGSDAIHTGYWTGNLATPDVTWESTYQYNIGLDASVLDGRLSFTAEWFRKDTKDLLLRKPAPQYNGGGSFWVNQGEVRNSGVEFTITATPLTDKDIFGWETSLNASYLKNKIIDLAGSDFIVGENYTSIGGGPIQIKKVGYPIGSFYLYEWANFNDQGANLYKHQSNGSLTTNPGADDLVTKGQAEPNWTFGWNNTFTWKNWTLNLFINAALGQDRLNVSRYAMGSMTGVYRFISLSDAYYKSWDKVANKADAVYASHKNSDNRNYPDSDFWLEDASFVKLKNISLTYNIPKKITKVADIQLSVSAQNLFTLTKYTGMDPEVYSESDYGFNGVDMGSYPVPRTFTFGMKLNF